jgi:hypothetical protein
MWFPFIHPSANVGWNSSFLSFFFQFCEVKVWQNWLKNNKFSQNCIGKTHLSKSFLENNFLGYKNLQKKKKKEKTS